MSQFSAIMTVMPWNNSKVEDLKSFITLAPHRDKEWDQGLDMSLMSFCVIKQYYCGNCCGMVVN